MMIGTMLINPVVQQELKLDPAGARVVQSKLYELARKQVEVSQNLRQLGHNAPPEKYRKLIDDYRSDVDQSLKAIFTKEQRARFEQLSFQSRSIAVFSDRKVAAKLKLSDEQRDKLRGVMRDMLDSGRKLLRNRQGAPADRRKALEASIAIRKEAMRKSIEILTKEQRKEFGKMTGKRVDLFSLPSRANPPAN